MGVSSQRYKVRYLPVFREDIAADLDPAGIANARNTYGGAGTEAVKAQLEEARDALSTDEGLFE